jgi:hypothetical protein
MWIGWLVLLIGCVTVDDKVADLPDGDTPDPDTDPVVETDPPYDSDTALIDTDLPLDPRDLDRDGHVEEADCDEEDPDVYVGAPELCDGADNDCLGGGEDGVATWFPEFGRPVPVVFDPERAWVAEESGELRLCRGTFLGRVEVEGERFTLSGAGMDVSVINALADGSVLLSRVDATIEVRGVTLTGGDDLNGGGMRIQGGGLVTVTDAAIRDNHATSRGGGLFIEEAQLTLRRTEVTGNRSDSSGGGLYADTDGFTTLDQAVFIGNSATSVGGGMRFGGGVWSLLGTRVEGNSSGVAGGGVAAVAALDGSIDAASVIVGNQSADRGGGVYLDGSDATIAADIVDNNAVQLGGGLRVTGDCAVVLSGAVRDNLAEGSGGGLSIEVARVELDGGSLLGNDAQQEGGGARIDGAGVLTLRDATVSGNTAGGSAGGVMVNEGALNAISSTFEDNEALAWGGAIRSSSLGALDLTDVVMRHNRSFLSGGAMYVLGSELVMDGGEVEGNVATEGGGGARLLQASTVLDGVRFVDNTAELEGGALAIEDSDTEMVDVVLRGNTATDPDSGDGGAVRTRRGTLTATRVVTEGNSARTGGGWFLRGGAADMTDCTWLDNDAPFHGGGIELFEGELNLYGGRLEGNTSMDGGGVFVVVGALLDMEGVVFSTNGPDDVQSGGSYVWALPATSLCNGSSCAPAP